MNADRKITGPVLGKYLVVGLNHKSAPIGLREKLAFTPEEAKAAGKNLIERQTLAEVLVLSTCNRVEIYGILPSEESPASAIEGILTLLSAEKGLHVDDLRPHIYSFQGVSAIHHGFRVVASLDSLVVGEPQIAGQLKEAYRLANEIHTIGFYLSKFFHRLFFIGKRVRTETKIGAGAVSVGYAACELGRQIFTSLQGKIALVLGAGEIGGEIIEHLVAQELGELVLANRGEERALKLQKKFGGTVIPLSQAIEHLKHADIVMSSLGVSDPFWTKSDLEQHLRGRSKPLFMIDVSVPRSLDSDLNDLEPVYLYNIDDLKEAISRNESERREEAGKAETLIQEEVEAFSRGLEEGHDIAPTISSLTKKFHDIKTSELNKTFNKLKDLPPETREAFSRCADAIVGKILHTPISGLKESHSKGKEGDASRVRHFIETIGTLFNLE